MKAEERADILMEEILSFGMDQNIIARAIKGAENDALEKAARLLDEYADQQEKVWKEHLAKGNSGNATSYHSIPRKYAKDIRELIV